MTEHADFLVITTDGQLTYGAATPGRPLREAISAHVPDLATQGMGRLRAWFADDFSADGLYTNPVADLVLARLGYQHPSGWYGPVALTMEEDAYGDIAPIPAEVRATVDELVQDFEHGEWAPLVRHAPELLDELMYMSTIELDGREVRQYKHYATRRYLHLDTTGQAWRIAVSEDGQTIASHMPLDEAKTFILGME